MSRPGSLRVLSRQFTIASLTLLAAACLLYPFSSQAIIANPEPVQLSQPDGNTITLRIHGDEFFHWFEDLQGYTVMVDQGKYVYATLDGAGLLAPTALMVGMVEPANAGLAKGILPSVEARRQLRTRALPGPSANPPEPPQQVPAHGVVKNLVILCKFSNHVFGTHTRDRADYDVIFNTMGGHPTLAPTGSVKDYYTETSYGTMTLNSTVVAWVTLPQTEAYYANGTSGMGGSYPTNPQGMVRDALSLVDPLVNFADFDTDNDGFVDAITIIHSGYAGETGGGGGNWIWSHRWSLWALPGGKWTSADVNGGGANVKVFDYHTEAALWGTSGTGIVRIGVIAHETGHYFGLPDLYDTDYSSHGIGSYCLMANSWGFDGTQQHPPHFSAWCKAQLGWVVPTVIGPGNYTVPQVQTSPSVFKINAGYPAGEYLLVENRQRVGYETTLPQGGLAVWHVDEAKADNKQEGYPGQAGWPGNNNHFKIALLQADGLYDLEHKANQGDAGDLYRGGGVSEIGAGTVPNTHAYKGGTILVTSNRISAVSAAGASMTFTYSSSAPAGPSITSFTPTSGAVGASVVISGANFTGATAARFNGVNATYTVNTANQITATVPAGATTGAISVVTPGGTATSATSFTVTGGSVPNDNFASGQVINGNAGTVNGSNVGATKEAGEPNHAGGNAGGKSIWYYWTAPSGGPVTMDTVGSSFDTLLGVYTGSSVAGLTLVANSDDSGTNNQSAVGFTAVAGTVYRIAVDGYDGAAGSVVLRWALSGSAPSISGFTPASGAVGASVVITGANLTGATAVRFNGAGATYTVNTATQITATVPAGATTGLISVVTPGGTATSATSFTVTGAGAANDSFANGQVISGNAGTINGSNVGATKEAGEPLHAGNVGGKSIWYYWTAPGSGPVSIDTLGTSFDTLLGVYTGSTVGALTLVASNDDTGTNRYSAVSFAATAGTIYRIAVDGYDGDSGSVVVRWSLTLGNDNFASAQVISGSAGSVTGSNVGATNEAGEPGHAGNPGGKSIWYYWTAPGNGPVAMDTVGSSFDTLLGVYTGSAVGALTVIASNDDIPGGTTVQSQVNFIAVGGTVYRIAVDGYGGSSGSVVFRWAWSPSAPSISGFTPMSGAVGTSVVISGANLTGATAVRFNGVNASYIVNTATQITATVPAGATTGFISVATPGGSATSATTFTVTSGSNDSFANGQVISGNAGSVNGSNATATKEAGEPSHAGNAGGKSLWYYWTAPGTGPVTLDTVGSGFDTLLGVYTGNSVGALTPIASNDDTVTNTQSAVSLAAVAGTVYRIAVDGYDGDSGSVVVRWSQILGNDNFASGQVISGNAGTVNGSNDGATKEAGEPNHAAGNAGGKSIWYFWTAPGNGAVTMDTVRSSFDTMLGVYTGSSVGALTPIASNDDTGTNTQSAVSFIAVAGTVYRIAVDGYNGVSGSVVLKWGWTPVAPSLGIAVNAANVVVSWPTNPPGYSLWWATNLPPTSWTSNSSTPVIVNGRFTVNTPVSGQAKFFRLKQ